MMSTDEYTDNMMMTGMISIDDICTWWYWRLMMSEVNEYDDKVILMNLLKVMLSTDEYIDNDEWFWWMYWR